MSHPPSAYSIDGMTEVDENPIIVAIEFYWHNDELGKNMSNSELYEFLRELVHSGDERCYFRYIDVVREVFDQSVYVRDQHLNPFVSDDGNTEIELDAATSIATIILPRNRLPEGWTRDDIVDCFNDYREILPDTLWESRPGRGLVHRTGAVVDFQVL